MDSSPAAALEGYWIFMIIGWDFNGVFIDEADCQRW